MKKAMKDVYDTKRCMEYGSDIIRNDDLYIDSLTNKNMQNRIDIQEQIADEEQREWEEKYGIFVEKDLNCDADKPFIAEESEESEDDE